MAGSPDSPTMIVIMMETNLFNNSLSELTIDLSAIAANYDFLAKQSANAECAAVVKADAYGLGLDPIARVLEKAGCKTFFVATLDEALALRKVTTKQIYVFAGITSEDHHAFLPFSIRPVLNSIQQVQVWNSRGPAAIHVDTGMNRLGLTKSDFLSLFENIANGEVKEPNLILSHLACAEQSDNELNLVQLKRFRALTAAFEISSKSLSASSGIFLGSQFYFDMVRPGYAIYGGNPTQTKQNLMCPVINLKVRILQCRKIKAGDTVGYGATFRSDRVRWIATIGMGYADGYLRALSENSNVYVKGKIASVVGRISMDLISVDITGIEGVKPGDWAEVIGSSISVDELAERAGTIGYEILTSLGQRHKRIYIGANI